MSLYPLPMAARPTTGGEVVQVIIDRDGWRFSEEGDRLVFEAMPVADRMNLRAQFEGQVELAKATPTAQTMANFRRAGL